MGRSVPRAPRVFVFGGQGPEWWAMGRELFAAEAPFAEAVRACEAALAEVAPGLSIEREFRVAEADSRMGDVEVLQPVLFALHVGLVAQLKAWGVEPDAVVGHSFGELSAAHVAGALSLQDAMRVHVLRSRLMKRLAGAGRMALVDVGPERARAAIAGLEGRLAVGVVNSPESVVLSGEAGALARVLAALAQEGVTHRDIPMPYPVHGPQMRAVEGELLAALGELRVQAPTIPLYSTVTGGEGGAFDARHWAANICEPARFAEAIDALLARGLSTFVEIGPHPTLGASIAQCAARRSVRSEVLPSLRRKAPERATLRATVEALEALARGASEPEARPLPERLSALPGPARPAALVRHLQALLGQRLGLSQAAWAGLDPSAPFSALGLDSVVAVELAATLGRDLGRRLPATLLFEHPTLEAVTAFLLAELGLAPAAPRARRERSAQASGEPIAIVGVGCRFPGGVDGPAAYWRLLEEGVDAVTEVPAHRWDAAATFDPEPDAPGKTYSRWAGFLDAEHGGERFDAAFFGVAPREAQSMDPQQRLLLEVSWEALEHAGIVPRTLAGSRTGVFVGLCTADYGGRLMYAADPREFDAYTFTGNSPSVAAGRLSYVLGLEGPALVVDTACSSSLVALHLACRSLREGESDLALAGGVNLILSPTLMIYFSRLRAMSRTGRSRAFDAGADGYVRGEGCGVVVLKRLSEARAANDRILAVVRGSAVNQDGRSSGLTAPNGLAQQAVVREALRDARLEPARVGYVEAHGTGTPLGDPIEVRALAAVLGEGRPAERPLVIGSVKTNIGHTEGAAGIAGVIKAALALRHARIPRSLHYRAPNPHIPWDEIPVKVAAAPLAWESDGQPRVAGISSFGFSGTNAHIVLEEAPAEEARPQPAEPPVAAPILLSGRTEEALRAQARRFSAQLGREPQAPLADLACTLATARTHFERRASLQAKDHRSLLTALEAVGSGQSAPGAFAGQVAEGDLAFLFTGQGSQRPGMGRALYQRFAPFREALDALAACLDPQLPVPLLQAMWAEEGSRLDETALTQPALFALEVALFRLLEAWGVRPAWLAGHSVGELAAAHVAGVLSLEDACTLVAARGRLMQALPPGGAMVALEATEEEVRPFLQARPAELSLGSINGPRSVVVSGDERPVQEVASAFAARGRSTTRLTVSHAFHSPRVEPMLEELRAVAARLTFRPPQIPIVSTLTGRKVAPEELCAPDYWGRQARGAVDFAGAMRSLDAGGARTYLELGPQGVLSALGPACLESGAGRAFVPSLRRGQPEPAALAEALGRLHVLGVRVDWPAFYAALGARRAEAPTYAYQRQRHWVEERRQAEAPAGAEAVGHPLLTAAMPLAATGGLLLTSRLSLAEQPWLSGHVVQGTVLLPGTAFLDLALAAASHVGLSQVEDLTLAVPLALPSTGAVDVQLSLSEASASGARSFELHARAPSGAWQRHASGMLGAGPAAKAPGLGAWPPPGAEALALEGLYARLERVGLSYGDSFRRVKAAWKKGDDLYAEVALEQAPKGAYALHPALLDAALHVLVDASLASSGGLSLPFSWSGVALHRASAQGLRVRLARQAGGAVALTIADERGEPVADVAALVTRPAQAGAQRGAAEHLLHLEWRPCHLGTGGPGAWAFVGAEPPGPVGPAPRRYASVAELRAALDAGAPAPEVLAWYVRPEEGASGVRAAVEGALAFLQAALADSRLERSAVAVVTRGALEAGPGDAVADVAGAAVGGLVRSAGAEHPSRTVVHVDLDDDARSPQVLPAALASGEAQVALRRGAGWAPRLARAAPKSQPARPAPGAGSGTVLITGGTGALGASVARHLVRTQGARDLLLVSRRGASAPGAEELARELEAAGARVRLAACDVADAGALKALLDSIPPGRPLRGVIHASGALDDGVLASLEPSRLERVFAPKLDAALHLDALTRTAALDYFVLFSSLAAAMGPAGQASYAAANAGLNALAQRRRAAGLPAVSVGFGPWAEGGMAARLDAGAKARLARYGLGLLGTGEALAALGAAVAEGAPLAIACALTAPTGTADEVPALWRHLLPTPRPAPAPPAPDFGQRLATLPAPEREQALRDLVREETARALRLSPGDVPWDRPFRDLGMDSLVAVELRGVLSKRLARSLSATLVFDHPYAAALARHLAGLFAEPAPAPEAPAPAPVANVDEMSESELDALLQTLQNN